MVSNVGEVIDLDTRRPMVKGKLSCLSCGYPFVAVYPKRTAQCEAKKPAECPHCKSQHVAIEEEMIL